MFDKHELEIIERALKRSVDAMRSSDFVGDDDPHLIKYEALQAKVASMRESTKATDH